MAVLPLIIPISGPDLPILAESIRSFKVGLAINRFLFHDWPNEAAQKPVYRQAIEFAFNDPAAQCLKAIDHGSKEILGFIVLTRIPPKVDSPAEEESATAQEIPEGMNPVVLSTITQATKEISQETNKLDRLEVTFIYVDPSNRKHGIGSLLLQEACSRAKAEGVPLSLCSEPEAYEFYKKKGFRDIGHADIDLSKWAPPFSGYGIYRFSEMVWS